jgi:hypothetical protein
MCNQPERLRQALSPLGLLVPRPVGRWGMAWVKGGEVLVSRTPRPADVDLDLAQAIAEPRSDTVLITAVGDGGDSDDVPPFRFRRFLLSEDPTQTLAADAWPGLAAHVPEFLRRTLHGRTTAELTLHTLVALLHDQGRVDDDTLRVADLARVLVEATQLVRHHLVRAGIEPRGGAVAASNTRALAVVAHDRPLAIHALYVDNDRGRRDPSFRGVAVTAGIDPARKLGAEAAVPEIVPPGSVVTVSRELGVAIAPLATSAR